MEIGIGSIVLIVLVVWYLGSAINNVLSGAGELASKEFIAFSQEQDLRLRKGRVKRYKSVEKMSDDKVYTDKEWDNIFDNNMEKHD